MKLIIAMIQPDTLQAVQDSLKEPDVYTLYVSQVADVRQLLPAKYRGCEYPQPQLLLRLEMMVVNDLMVHDVIDTIVRIASEPNRERGNKGSIFVTPLDAWVCIPDDQPATVGA